MRDVETLKPFTRFLMTIGTLPSSYLVSMTYEEQLLWFCNFLKNEVIPTVNNNAEAVIELQNYVSSYFDNLDVQEEINNKLDEMAESGTLQEIISEYLNSIAVFGFDTVNDMKSATNLIDGSFARTLGYRSLNDKGGALYKIRTITNEDIVDNMFIIPMNDETLIAELITINAIAPEQLGAYGDGTHDDSDVIDAYFKSLKANEHVHLTGNYGMSKSVKLPTKYGITIDGGSFTALSGFDHTVSYAMLYIIGGTEDQPDGFGVPSTGLRLSNITFMCNSISDGIEMDRGLNVNIDKCLFLLYKNYGINVTTLYSHDLIITGCQFRGNVYQGETTGLNNIGIYLNCADSIVKDCVFAYGHGGLSINRGANLIEGCHFYSFQNDGFNLKLGSFNNMVSGCYFDSGHLWLSSGWKNLITDCLFTAGNSTQYIVRISSDSNTASFRIENCLINDERTNQTSAIDFFTLDNGITNLSNSKFLKNQLISGNITLNNPLNGLQLNEVNPSYLALTKYVAPVNNTTYALGTRTPIDGSTQYYKSGVCGNTNEIEFIGASDFYQYLVVPFIVTERSRIIPDLVSEGASSAIFYDKDFNHISNNKATLDPGLYYIATYKNVSRCTLKVNA